MTTIDWDNLPPCTQEIIISPRVCMDEYIFPEQPVSDVPIAGTLPLVLIGVLILAAKRRGK